MTHLSIEELLLSVDGELHADSAAHLQACSHCQLAFGTLAGRLTEIVSSLRTQAGPESPDAEARALTRLRRTMRRQTARRQPHLSTAELLLRLEGKSSPEKTAHLKSCPRCTARLVRTRRLLAEIEGELRALIPEEPQQKRLASAAAIEKKLDALQRPVSFPVQWPSLYAAAAALALSVFAGMWFAQLRQPADAPAADTTAESAAPVSRETARSATRPQSPPERVRSATAPQASRPPSAPVRFDLRSPQRRGPAEPALNAEPPPAVAVQITPPVWGVPSAPTAPPPPEEPAEQPVRPPTERRSTSLEGRWLAVKAGVWDQEVAALESEDGLLFQGTLPDEGARARFIEAVLRRAGSRRVRFDLVVRDAERPAPSTRAARWDNGRIGGPLRSALLRHYRDAARRSFASPQPARIEAEVARYVDQVFRSQSRLVQHSYALNGLLGDAETVRSAEDSAARGRFRDIAQFHLAEITRREAAIYNHLSEALPRRFWMHRGEQSALADRDPSQQGSGLLDAVLGLEEDLAVLLSGDPSQVVFVANDPSPGESLHRIRQHVKRLRDWTQGLK